MTRDEFALMRMRQDYDLYKKLCVVDVIVVVAFIVMFAIMVVTGRVGIKLGNALIILAIALQLPAMFKTRDSYGAALGELEAAAVNPEAPISEATYRAVENLITDSRQLRQQVIAYSILTVVIMIGTVVILMFAEGEPVLIGAGAILGAMGVGLGVLAFQAYRSLKVARELEANE